MDIEATNRTITSTEMNIKAIIATTLALSLAACETNDSRMRKEADTFLEQMGGGLQPMQRDAIWDAIRGNNQKLEQIRKARNSQPAYPSNVNVTHPATNMRLYTNTETNAGDKPLLVYLHGGGWTIGSLNSCARFCSEVCSQGGACVLAVDYRLAPEHPYPASLDDCEKAIRFAIRHASEWGCSAKRIIVGGDSSGGNLAIAATLRTGEGEVAGLLLFYPVTKAWNDGSQSWQKYNKGFGLDGDLMEVFNRSYISPEHIQNAEVSPLCAKDETLKSLPHTLLIAAGRDILADQGSEFVERIATLGVDATRIEFPGAVHLFITVPGQSTAFKEAVSLAVKFLDAE